MRLLVSITQTRNLHGHNPDVLVADLKAGKSFLPGHGLHQDKAALEASSSDTLCISIRNTQTQAYVYERKIPLSIVFASWSSWVGLLAPGDPIADQAPPSWEQPQIFVCLEFGSSNDLGSLGRGAGFEDLEVLQHAFSKLERELELNKQQARERTPSTIAARPSLLDREAAEIQAKERDMAAIKAKISAMSDAKRQANSAEEQLKEVMQEVAKMRDRLMNIEAEVKDVGDRKQATETEIAKLQRGISEAKETLRLRTLSVAELRSNRDETERQLSQTLREREQWRESASKAQQDFDSEVKSASVELDHWRSEAQELANSIEELDEQKKALAEKASLEQDSQKDFMKALQKELEEAMLSFTSMEAQREDDDQHLAAAEMRQRDAEQRLHDAEQAADELRAELRQEGAEAKTATEAVKKDLAEKVSKVAQLEGSLSENRNLLKAIQQRVDGLMQDVMDRSMKSIDEEAALTTLERQVQQQQQELEQLQLQKEKLERATSLAVKKSEERCSQKQLLQDGSEEEQGQLAQRSDMLTNTQKLAFSELELTSAKMTHLQQAKRQLDAELAEIAAAAGDVEGCRQEARQRIEELQQALEAVSTKKSVQMEAVTSRLHKVTSMEQELIAAKQELQGAMAAANKLRVSVARAAAENVNKDPALEKKTKLLKEFLAHRAASLRQASKESSDAEKNVQALQQEQRSLQEEYRVAMDEMKIQVSKGNDHYTKLQQFEEDIRTFDDESELLTLGLHDAEHRKAFLLQEHELLQKASGFQQRHLLADWAKEVLRVRVAAQVKSYEDELEHWKQAASDDQPESQSNASSHQKAAEELLREKVAALEEQLAAKEKELKEIEKQVQKAQIEEVPGNIRSVPSALHGSLFLGPTLSKMEAVPRRALVIGCNYCSSFAPLLGCANDAWNVQCLLRQSLQYPESQVHSLIEFSDSTASPPKRRPTRENILAELQWLTQSAKPGENVLFYFSGYGAQQPESQTDGLYEGHLVPTDFADNFPEDIVHELRHCNTSPDSRLSPDVEGRAVQAGGYRLVPMSLITSALHSLPPTCKVTVLLDCCQSSVVPLLRHSEARSVGPSPGPPLFKRLAPNVQVLPADVVSAKIRLLNLPPLPGGHGLARMASPSGSPSRSPASPHRGSPTEAQSSALEATQRHRNVTRGGPSCKCYSFSTCQNDQVCCELPIEGCVQGAGTWAFVKAVAACHFSVSLTQHSKAMDTILQNLRRKYRWIQQTPVIQLSASANVEDTLILP